MSLASAAAGADGLIVEVHHNPKEALSDKAQALLPEAFDKMIRKVRTIRACVESLS
jgi:3-deoxy-7-phosphoheptulonate synthase